MAGLRAAFTYNMLNNGGVVYRQAFLEKGLMGLKPLTNE